MSEQILVREVYGGAEMSKVIAIRREVFVVEQNCPPELEWEHEDVSHHFLAEFMGEGAGAARWRETEKGYKLERFAVLKRYRRKGVGQALVTALLNSLPQDSRPVYLHAQVAAMALYAKFGFISEGEPFEEAGIMHYRMSKSRS